MGILVSNLNPHCLHIFMYSVYQDLGVVQGLPVTSIIAHVMQGGVGMSGSLVDNEQFPRNDIDIYTVRHARQQILRLQNDHRELMKQIEQGLYAVHAAARDAKPTASSSVPEAMEIEKPDLSQTAFVRVDRVDQGSPAAQAGLEVEDLVIQFGSITLDNFNSLQDIGKLVQHSVGRPVGVTVCRGDKELRLALVPNTWHGQGLLGCNVVPVKR